MKTFCEAPNKAMRHLQVLILAAYAVCTLLWHAPARFAANSTSVVISEFRTRGPNGGNDEFIELFNASPAPVSIAGWRVEGSNSSGTVSTRATVNPGTVLNSGCHYLITNSNPSGGPYSGAVAGDQTYGVGITDDGGIALAMPGGMIIDQVGMSTGAFFKEGPILDPLTSNSNRGYERRPGGTAGSSQDTDNNRADFRLLSPSEPQSAGSLCLSSGAPSSPTAVGAANPGSVEAGAVTLLIVSVSPGSNPPSTGISVTGNLSPIGGSSFQSFFDDGTNGDATAGDSKFSFQATVGAVIAAGSKNLTITVADGQGRSNSAFIALTIESTGSVTCGVERWSVKTGTDTDAFLIDMNMVLPITIAEMRSWTAPSPIPSNTRTAPQERTVYAVSGTLTDYKLEDDSDYHLVIRDEAGTQSSPRFPAHAASPHRVRFLRK